MDRSQMDFVEGKGLKNCRFESTYDEKFELIRREETLGSFG